MIGPCILRRPISSRERVGRDLEDRAPTPDAVAAQDDATLVGLDTFEVIPGGRKPDAIGLGCHGGEEPGEGRARWRKSSGMETGPTFPLRRGQASPKIRLDCGNLASSIVIRTERTTVNAQMSRNLGSMARVAFATTIWTTFSKTGACSK
jgi:hypothetical protein